MNRGVISPRRRGGRELRRTVLIVCEGRKTEQLYFGRFREALRGFATVKLEDSNDKDPKRLAAFAKTQKERFGLSLKEGRDFIWIVFDADENSQTLIDVGAKAARNLGAEFVMSNPCFELWYLLHFEDRRETIDRKEVLARLKRYLPDYGKNLDIYDKLLDGKSAALERARRLAELSIRAF